MAFANIVTKNHRLMVCVGDVYRFRKGEDMSRQGSELRKKRRQLGLCCQCGKPAQGKSRCPACLMKAAAVRRRYVARMTPDEREKMYAKEIMRQKMAREMAVEIRHMKYIEEVKSLERKDTPEVTVKLTGLAKMMIESEG